MDARQSFKPFPSCHLPLFVFVQNLRCEHEFGRHELFRRLVFTQGQRQLRNGILLEIDSQTIYRKCYLNIKLQFYREEATSALAGFHEGPQSRSNWNLERETGVGFSRGRITALAKEKMSEQGENRQQTKPTYGNVPVSNLAHTGGR